ncbi:MAG: Membrane protein involved in the export of O-antigen and teichoic acid [Rhodospirillales bacterium]|nr:Membrane protein involved in the export of O-antigen and teichoic acid [Rhodospirillales bacterium]
MENQAVAATETSSHHGGRRALALNFLAVTGASLLSRLLGLVTSVYVRRTLGPAVIGQVSWNVAVLSYLTVIASPGLQLLGQREITLGSARPQAMVSLVITLQAICAIVAYGAALLIAALDLRGPEISYLLVLQGIALLLSALNVSWILQAHERMVVASLVDLAVVALQLPALILLVHGPDDVVIYVICNVPFTIAGLACKIWYLRKCGLFSLTQFQPTLAGGGRMLSEAWPMALSQAAVLIYTNSDAVILGFSKGNEAVGLYTTAYNLMLVPTMISGSLWNAYFPALTRAKSVPADASRIAAEFARMLAWMGLPLAAFGWGCGRYLLGTLYGVKFGESGLYFEWLSLNVALIFINTGLASPLLSWGYQRSHFKIAASGAVLNLVLNLALIPRYGAWGAVFTTLASEVIVFATTIYVRWRIGFGRGALSAIYLRPFLCSLAVAAAFAAVPPSLARHWWLTSGMGALIVLACMMIFEKGVARMAFGLFNRS